MDLGLSGKHVFITGASGGIGATTAEAFLAAGAKVTLHANSNKNPAHFEALKTKYQDAAFVVYADATNEDQVIQSVKDSVAHFGTAIDVMVINHGIFLPTVPFTELSLDRWNQTFSVNTTGTFLFAREFLRNIDSAKYSGTEGPSIVMVGSTSAMFGEAGHADYSSSKSAIQYGMLHTLKNEIVRISRYGRVNVVAPGWVRTPLSEDALNDTQLVSKALQTIALRKVATTDDCANSSTA